MSYHFLEALLHKFPKAYDKQPLNLNPYLKHDKQDCRGEKLKRHRSALIVLTKYNNRKYSSKDARCAGLSKTSFVGIESQQSRLTVEVVQVFSSGGPVSGVLMVIKVAVYTEFAYDRRFLEFAHGRQPEYADGDTSRYS